MVRRLCRVIAKFAVALMVCSCGIHEGASASSPSKDVKNPTFTLYIDKGFSGPERELIVDAFQQWERDSNGTVKFKTSRFPYDASVMEMPEAPDGKCTYDTFVVRVNSDEKVVKQIDKRIHSTTLGFTSSTCKQRVVALVVDRLKDGRLFRNVAVHEAGHLVGLDHIPVPKESVMFPSMDKAQSCPTSLDMKQFCMLYECDWHDMKTCD